MLWRIKSRPLEILGSIHVMDAAPFALPPSIDAAYAKAQRLVFEYDFTSQPSPSIVSLPEGETLRDVIPATLFAGLHALWTQAGLPEAALERSSPWLAALQLQLALAAKRGISAERGIDRLLWQRAIGDRKPIVGLETPDEALRGFTVAPRDEQIRFLAYTVESQEESQAELDATLAAWRSGEMETLEPLLARWLKLCPTMFQMLVAGRNLAWLPRLQKLTGDGVATLAVAGAVHCIGASGLPALLAQAGETVTRLD
jgi:uncharacterized protein